MGDAASLRSSLHAFRTSLLRTPAGYVAGAILLTVALVPIEWSVRGTPLDAIADVGRAQDILPAIGGATLTLAGFVLTMATLSVQFGASTYAPRLVEQIRRDRVLGHTIGLALGTFTFSFLVLVLVRPSHEASAAVAVAISLAGATATVLLFVALLDRLIGALRPGQTMQSITTRTLGLIPKVYPPRTGREADAHIAGAGAELPDVAAGPWDSLPMDGVVWRTDAFGTLVDARFSDLVDQARSCDAQIALLLPVGAFLQDREAIAVVRNGAGEPSTDLAAGLREGLLGSLVISHERTVDADPAYGMRLLVDIALRALSPGVNDPTTATQAIDHLGQLVVSLAARRLGPRELRDDEGVLRVTVPAPGWEPLVGLAFDELIEAAASVRVRRHLRSTITLASARVGADRRSTLDACAARIGS